MSFFYSFSNICLKAAEDSYQVRYKEKNDRLESFLKYL